ncbi:hypothetical protein BU23DRAFT_532822 [Bimuria novae-zelandiae CBS 107.79]|uniref:alpha-galactosidase n=1 Tax=Bimuria novae-zelandiae CBS 107.79 TaxID=1447943 RepID=A0A6A5VF33_9PLEO|nr:hypothetical protein BU23DRAFT_532822 [Bimuria novae-zelandiae CBS 107.79]
MSQKKFSHPNLALQWFYRRACVAIIVIVVLGLALGLDLGLTIGRDKGDSNDNEDDNGSGNDSEVPAPTISASPLPTPTGSLPWRPRVNDTWQIVLSSGLLLDKDATSVIPDVAVYDIDLFDNSKDTIDTLHRLGKKVICYFSGGSYESGRPDSADFKDDDMGKALDGWPDERWLKLGNENVRKIMKGRVELAKEKGCDGVDPDNVDGYQNENGLDLTADDSISFLTYLSNITTPLNLTVGLKNAGDIISNVLPIVHFSVNEQCVDESECDTFHAFIDAGKPVFHIEYPKGSGDRKAGLKKSVLDRYCSKVGAAKGRDGFSTVLKTMDLDGWVEYCDQDFYTTAVNRTDPEQRAV